MSDMRYPIKLNDDYTCQGIDAAGKGVVFGDLLREGERVGPHAPGDELGEAMYADGIVVRRDDGLWVEPLRPVSAGSDGEDRPDET